MVNLKLQDSERILQSLNVFLASLSSTSEGGLFDVKRWASGADEGLFAVRVSSFENIVECTGI